jgi:putative inorganic carbon (hco3(-)) transporter
MRDLLLLASMLYLVPVAVVRPWVGILAWFWISYFVPHSFTWGFGRRLPVAALVGGATLLGFLFTRERKPLPGTWSVMLMFLFAVHMTLTTMLAFNPGLAWVKWNWIAKGFLMTFVTMCLFQDVVRLRSLYMVPAICLGLLGLKGFLWVVRTGGGSRVFGPELSFFADNNEFGLAVCMALPLMLYLARDETRTWVKRLLHVLFSVSIVAVLFTYSRGAFLGLATLLGVLIWRSPWRMRFAAGVLVAGLIVVPLAPQALKDRIVSIQAQESAETRDGSAAGRIEAWTTAWRIAVAHPFAGEGFRALWNPEIWNEYFGYNPLDYTNYGYNSLAIRDVHSLYFEVLSEHGLLGFGLYIAIVVSAMATLAGVRRRWKGHAEYGYLAHYAEMNQLSLYPFLVAGTFLTFAYFDLFFLLVATSTILKVLSMRAEEAIAATAPPAALPATVKAPAFIRRSSTPPQARTKHA